MSTIQLLPEHIANQIAAGEVVEGPSSIIKELVENSIDAGASKIHIEVSKQFQRIQISDNGSGINPDEMSLAFKRHATSKIQTVDDIYTLMTNGFRGEALASIAAISRLTCISKRTSDQHASKIYLENGSETITQTGAADGTTIIVDDIFFNTPARLKFLKSNTKEKNLIIDLIRAFALANTKIAFSLKIDEKEQVKSSGLGDLQAAIAEIFKDDFASKLIAVNYREAEVGIEGYTSPAQLSRTDKRGIFTFINGRIVQCYILRSAIDAVYRKYLSVGKYPICIINLSLPADQVDVNVHPTKKEVKFQNTNLIYKITGDAISKALADSFYKSETSFQPSLQDHSLQSMAKPINLFVKTNMDVESLKESESKFKNDFTYNLPKVSLAQIYDEQKNNRESFEPSFSANNRKFISRFGAVDLSIFDSLALKTNISSQGSKTSFEIVVKDEDFGKSVLLRGDFIGENWIKDKYLEFLHELGEEVLEKTRLETNFAAKPQRPTRSRPAVNPDRKILEEIWQRDNYTCVYCKKALLHPDTIKKNLRSCEDKVLLNTHLASYDHHLPASKFPTLNEDMRNLYACCQECNIKKSNSLASQTWNPVKSNAWEDSVFIANLKFDRPD